MSQIPILIEIDGDVHDSKKEQDAGLNNNAAVHAGKITLSAGGKVTIIISDGVSTFTGSTRNGVTSYSQSGWTSKHFVFE